MTKATRPKRRIFAKFLLVVLLTGSLGAAFWFGLVPQRFSPLSPLSLSEGDQWFVDLRLATLRHDQPLCAAILSAPHILALPVPDKPVNNGCGWTNAVRVSEAGHASMPVGTITCEMAAALALWIEHDVQPLAEQYFSSRVTKVDHMGSYACRNIIGSKTWKGFRSQHARANALDVAGFRLANGRSISIARGWNGDAAEAQFWKAAHAAGCRYFRVAIGPDFNEAHHDHFHFDRGPISSCR